jgi:hypothetical protein
MHEGTDAWPWMRIEDARYITRATAEALGLPCRAFTLFPMKDAERVTIAMPSVWQTLSMEGRATTCDELPELHERKGWPEEWPEDVELMSVFMTQVGFGDVWKPARPESLTSLILNTGQPRLEVPGWHAEAFDLDPVRWILAPLAETDVTIASPAHHVARDFTGDLTREILATTFSQHPAGAPPGAHAELLVLERSGHPKDWPESGQALQACQPYDGPSFIDLLR